MDKQVDAEVYGIDWDGPIPPEDHERVEVPVTPNPLSNDKFEDLQEVNPLFASDQCGADLYAKTLDFVMAHNIHA